MIPGYFLGSVRRPVVDAVLTFDDYPQISLKQPLLIDTGSARTLLAPMGTREAERLGLPVSELPRGIEVAGVTGSALSRVARATLRMGTEVIAIRLTLMEWDSRSPSFVPSLLGRDVLSQFVLTMNERADAIWLTR